MVRVLTIKSKQLTGMLVRIAESGRLMAPVKKGKHSFAFAWVSDPRDVELDYVRTILPPKKALLPPREDILAFSRNEKASAASPVLNHEPFVVFGVHPCDLAGLRQLDWAYMKKDGVQDPHYHVRRAAATIIGLDCQPDEYCFCTSVGAHASREEADLFLTPVSSGYVVEVLTEKGAVLLRETAETREASTAELAEAESWRQTKTSSITRHLEGDVSSVPEILDRYYDHEVWERTAARCYSCGTCTTVCPTCICFDVNDELNLPLSAGSRQRQWDSCQYLDFALVAGPHNFRGERTSRVRHRWLRKFAFLHRAFGRPFCTGCGRCTQACTAEISLTEVLNEIMAEEYRQKSDAANA